jgi:hypothetical protein
MSRMAYLGAIKAWKEARPYLETLKQTILADVRPLLDLPERAPFAINRDVFCYIDHLGHLYSGMVGKSNVGKRFQAYLKQVMKKVDSNYEKRAGEIYGMYRNGPVHQFAPEVLRNKKGQYLKWLCYAGERIDYDFKAQELKLKVTHLEPVQNPTDDTVFYLPVSTVCLIQDLLSSIDEFQKMGPEDERVVAWNRVASELTGPQHYEFTVP